MPSPLSPEFREISIVSTLDGSSEPSLLYLPPGADVLCVGLHTWGNTRFNYMESQLPFCRERGWALLLPEFRGPNTTANPRAREAGGSRLARRDIVDATERVIADHFSSTPATFLFGGSGGAHMALQVAGREPFEWTAVSSWCPITDLAAWQQENRNYAPHIEAVCGGTPGSGAEVDCEYADRSPIHCSERLSKIALLLAHGRHDAVVPYTHSWRLAQEIQKRGSDSFYFQIFDGGHQMLSEQAFAFFDRRLQAARQNNAPSGNQLTG